MNAISTRGLAAQILQETAVAQPEALSKWVLLRDIRDKVLHPFDRERLRLAYKAGNAWDALKESARTSEWLEVRGDGLDLEVRAKYIPVDKFSSLAEALDRIKHLDEVFAHWKDIGYKLLLAEESIWSLKEHVKDTDSRLMRALALIFHFKVLATELHAQAEAAGCKNLRKVEAPAQSVLDSMWEGNTAAFGSLKLLLKDSGILDDTNLALEEE